MPTIVDRWACWSCSRSQLLLLECLLHVVRCVVVSTWPPHKDQPSNVYYHTTLLVTWSLPCSWQTVVSVRESRHVAAHLSEPSSSLSSSVNVQRRRFFVTCQAVMFICRSLCNPNSEVQTSPNLDQLHRKLMKMSRVVDDQRVSDGQSLKCQVSSL